MPVTFKYLNEDGTLNDEGKRLDKENHLRSLEQQYYAAEQQANNRENLEEQIEEATAALAE